MDYKLDANLVSQIKAAVDSNLKEQLSYTQQLIATGLQRGEEKPIQDLIYYEIKKRGYTVEYIEMDDKVLSVHEGGSMFSIEHSTAPLVVGKHTPKGKAKGKSLVLNAHIDIVPTGPEQLWKYGPYNPIIEGDWLYGRGGADMKAGSAINLYALDALKKIGYQPASEVQIHSVVEEESTGNGSMMLHLKGYTGDAVLIPEPEEDKLVKGNVGAIWFQVEVMTKPVHVREMQNGSNAIDAIYRIIGALRELEADWNLRTTGMKNYENLDHPLNLNIGKIVGGDWASSVPAWARIDCRIAILPGIKACNAAKEIINKVAEFADKDFFLKASAPPKVIFNGFFAEGYELEEGTDAEKVLKLSHFEAFEGEELESFVTAGYLDTRVHALYDKIPALCYGPVSNGIHGFDEAVSISSIKKITTAYALFIARWCGLEKVSHD